MTTEPTDIDVRIVSGTSSLTRDRDQNVLVASGAEASVLHAWRAACRAVAGRAGDAPVVLHAAQLWHPRQRRGVARVDGHDRSRRSEPVQTLARRA